MPKKSRSRSRRGGSWLDSLTGNNTQQGMYGQPGYGQPGYGQQGMYGQQGNTGSSWFGSNNGQQGMVAPGMGASGYVAPGMRPRANSVGTGYGASGYGTTGMRTRSSSFGGRKGKGKKLMMMGGSFSPNTSLTNLASSAEPISCSSSMRGGRTKRRRHRHGKSCKK